MAGQQAWHFEQVNIKDSEYAKKCGISGECYFYVSKGHIKIAQLDNKTSLDLSVSRIRNWGATSTSFFLDLGSRSPAGAGRLEMTHKDPNTLRLLVRDTTSSKKHKTGAGKSENTLDYAVEDENYGYIDDEDTTYGRSYSFSGQSDVYENPGTYSSLSRVPKKGGADQAGTDAAWHKKNTVRSEESERAINVRNIGSRRHVAVGDEEDTYTVVNKDNPPALPPPYRR
eukprot:TRINITY_DN57795_c0_g1_i1.p1 TRINITY_DN57795_c0_g1~~TRINITY_DN57795_c0_g1_i1.p1  ORF type:complete len:227 (-),score=77.96 TRINITY_DN57795_c0_g1_i1:174-854(-)